MRILPAVPRCNSNRCNSGRLPCPTPQACGLPSADTADDSNAAPPIVHMVALAAVGLVMWAGIISLCLIVWALP
jgi:hypothetical protein